MVLPRSAERLMGGSLFAWVAAFCGHDPRLAALGALGFPGALFLVGLIGGTVHCTGMCGPFVLAQMAADGERLSARGMGEWRRLRGAALLPYQLGRLTSYSLLGGLAGGLGGAAAALSGHRWLLGIFLALAALLLLRQGLAGIGSWWSKDDGHSRGHRGAATMPVPRGRFSRALASLTRPLFADPRGLRGFGLGVALGFLPCGFLYGALAVAAGTGSAVMGALSMAAFTFGTMPNLIAVGYVGLFFGLRSAGLMRWLAGPLMLANAAYIGLLAVQAFA